MIPIQKVKEIITRYNTLEKELSSANINPKLFAKKSKEYSDMGSIISIAKDYLNFDKTKNDLENILKDKSNDTEMIQMAKKDLSEIDEKKNYMRTK